MISCVMVEWLHEVTLGMYLLSHIDKVKTCVRFELFAANISLSFIVRGLDIGRRAVCTGVG